MSTMWAKDSLTPARMIPERNKAAWYRTSVTNTKANIAHSHICEVELRLVEHPRLSGKSVKAKNRTRYVTARMIFNVQLTAIRTRSDFIYKNDGKLRFS